MAAAAKYDSRRFSSHQLEPARISRTFSTNKSKSDSILDTTKSGRCVSFFEEQLYFKDEAIMPVSELGVSRQSHVENALAAIAVAKLEGIANEAIVQALHTFSGVPHRTQYVDTIEGVRFFNDSKATNSLATEMALGGFQKDQLILLAGGLDRGNSFDELIPSLQDLKRLFCSDKQKRNLLKPHVKQESKRLN